MLVSSAVTKRIQTRVAGFHLHHPVTTPTMACAASRNSGRLPGALPQKTHTRANLHPDILAVLTMDLSR